MYEFLFPQQRLIITKRLLPDCCALGPGFIPASPASGRKREGNRPSLCL